MGYSMIDWVRNDLSMPNDVRAQSVLEKELYTNNWLKICGDIATASKHFKLDRRIPITSSVISSKGYGSGRYGKAGYGIGEEGIDITLNDGTSLNSLDFVHNVVQTWKEFMTRHKI